jgi:adenosyl cobinamide kinase/adenosyl cobinamide phosphate guanylyltransferase
MIYGRGGVGKTSLVKTLPVDEDKRVLYIAADPGQLALRDREFTCVNASNWGTDTLREINAHIREHADDYDWVVVDGLDEIAEQVLKHAKANRKDARQAYGDMNEIVAAWAKAVRDLEGVSVIFITHISRLQNEENDVEWTPKFPGKQLAQNAVDWFDLVGCMRPVLIGQKQERLIQFQPEPDPRYFAKDRSGALEDFEEPNLGKILDKIHS